VVSDRSFSVQVVEFLENLVESMESEEALDDLDFDLIDGVLTVDFGDGSQIIINRQEAAGQIWVASPLGPAHFSFDPGQQLWLDDRSGESLMTTLEKAFSHKLGHAVSMPPH